MPLQSDLIHVIQQLSFCRDIEAVMTVLREAARGLTGADGVTVVLREGEFCHYAEENAVGPLWKGRRFPIKACISGWCMLHRQQLAIPDIYEDERIPHEAYRPTFVKSLAMTPIRAEDPIGAIGAYWAKNHHATADELATLQALGDSASMAIANVQLIDTLKEANRRKDQFLVMLAHELRNPLAPIRNGLYSLSLPACVGDKADRARAMMERQVEHMTRIIDDLLDVSRLTRGIVKLRRERIELGRFVRQCVEDRRNVLECAGLELAMKIPEGPIWAAVDAIRLTQILNNLLDNACKFTPRGGSVCITVQRDSENWAAITVRDTGVGIDGDTLPHVFEVFAQADRSLDRTKGGLGLGLSVVKGLVDLHGGTIQVTSNGVGQGAEFKIHLPCDSCPTEMNGASVESLKPAVAGVLLD